MNQRKISILANQKWVLSNREIETYLMKIDSKNIKFNKDKSILKLKYLFAFIIVILSFVRLLYIYIRQFFIVPNIVGKLTSIFLTVGRNYEINNMNKIIEGGKKNSVVIDAFILTDFMNNTRVGIVDLLKCFSTSVIDFFSVLRINFPNRVMFLIFKNGILFTPLYSYFKCFFLTLKQKYGDIKVYSDGALIQGQAAILSGLKVTRAYHGLMQTIHPDVYPDYHITYVYSEDEKRYLSKIGIDSNVYKFNKVTTKKKIVVFFMAESASMVGSSNFNNIVNLFKRAQYKILIKYHPLNKASENLKKEYKLENLNWGNILDLSETEEIDGISASSIIKNTSPSFVVAWGSTSLCESLNMGVIPIALLIDEDSPVYNMPKRSLEWPLKSDTISDLIFDKLDYDSELRKLKC